MIETSGRNCLATFGAFALMPFEQMETDLALHNGNFWTVNRNHPRAQAVAISDGRLLVVGSNAEVLHLASARTRKIDLGERAVLPANTPPENPEQQIRELEDKTNGAYANDLPAYFSYLLDQACRAVQELFTS